MNWLRMRTCILRARRQEIITSLSTAASRALPRWFFAEIRTLAGTAYGSSAGGSLNFAGDVFDALSFGTATWLFPRTGLCVCRIVSSKRFTYITPGDYGRNLRCVFGFVSVFAGDGRHKKKKIARFRRPVSNAPNRATSFFIHDQCGVAGVLRCRNVSLLATFADLSTAPGTMSIGASASARPPVSS